MPSVLIKGAASSSTTTALRTVDDGAPDSTVGVIPHHFLSLICGTALDCTVPQHPVAATDASDSASNNQPIPYYRTDQQHR